MVEVAQRVDYRNGRVFGKPLESAVIEHSCDNAVAPAREVLGVVPDSLSLADGAVLLIHVNAVAAESGDAYIKGNTGAERGLLEQGDDTLSLEPAAVVGRVLLHCPGKAYKLKNLVLGELH